VSSSPPPAAPAPAEAPAAAPRGWKGPWGWVTTTYFAEGFPYTIVNSAADALFTVMGMSLSTLGLTTLLHLPWNLKFLWGPFVDGYETKRRWLLATEVVLCGLLLVLTLAGGVDAPLGLLAAVFMVIAIISATHDIAIDGFYLEGLDPAGQSRYVGYRAAAFRLAMLAVNGPLMVIADAYGWRLAWLLSLLVMMALTAYHALALPRPETRQRPGGALLRRVLHPRVVLAVAALAGLGWLAYVRGWGAAIARGAAAVPVLGAMSLPGWIGLGLLFTVLLLLANVARVRRALDRRDSPYARSFLAFLDQPRVRAVLAFVLLFRTGESFLQKMRWPFLNRELGMDLGAYGFANGTVGLLATFIATLLGGWLIARYGLRRFVWPFLLAQNLLNLLYAGLALWPEPAAIGLGTITVVVTVEHFGAGLGTAVLMVYLMRCCDPAHKAAHMALLTALASVGFTLAGVASGALAELLGYGPYFVLTFVATLPSMALVLIVPHLDR
jgi:MFS transporter, PAT family, beta-lactamase induction signal transducer AmpG